MKNFLIARDAKFYGINPLYSNEEIDELGFRPWTNDEHIDAVILHTEYVLSSEYDPKLQKHKGLC